MAYDAFISYSHAADGLLAPRLQAGLQRFAKPWWKRRAIRVFRDESSLSASPHLWASITDALDDSAWLVLLLSPEAAKSEWVNSEIEHWLEHKSADRILAAVTEGEFDWQNPAAVAPPALRGVFAQEPRWLDLRWARDQEHLDLNNARFRNAIADIASTVRGIPKDDLESEEVRQHRRTRRTAWAAGIIVLLLAVAASFGAIVALDQRRDAQVQRDQAQRLAEAEAEARANAEALAVEAERLAALALLREADATERAAAAEARRLLAHADAALASDTQLSMLLALVAHETAPPDVRGEATEVLRTAAKANRLLGVFPLPEDEHLAVLSPDAGTVYYTSWSSTMVTALDAATGKILWSVDDLTPGEHPVLLSISPNGRLLALELRGREGERVSVAVYGTGDGRRVQTLDTSGCEGAGIFGPGFSPDGSLFSMYDGTPNCGESPDNDWAAIYDTQTWSASTYSIESAWFEQIAFNSDSSRAVVSYDGETGRQVSVVEYPSGQLIVTYAGEAGVINPGGESFIFLTVGDAGLTCDQFGICAFDEAVPIARTIDLRNGSAVDIDVSASAAAFDTETHVAPFSFSPDGTLLAVSWDSEHRVLSASGLTGVLLSFPGGDAHSLSWSADSARLLVAHEDALYLWAVRISEVTPPDGPAGDWVAFVANDLILRDLTMAECSIHRIDPCPTLEELQQSGSAVGQISDGEVATQR